MPHFTIHMGVDARVYGDVEVDADTLDAAVAMLTPDFVAANFETKETTTDHVENLSIIDVEDADGNIVDDYSGVDLPIEPDKAPVAPVALKADNLKTFSLFFAWADNDPEQGEYGTIVRAANHDEAEAKGRADMRENHLANNGAAAACVNCGCTDNDGSDVCPDCGGAIENDESECEEYEHKDFQGNVIFGGRLIESHVGAIWKAAELEAALRALRTAVVRYEDDDDLDAAKALADALIAEIDNIEKGV